MNRENTAALKRASTRLFALSNRLPSVLLNAFHYKRKHFKSLRGISFRKQPCVAMDTINVESTDKQWGRYVPVSSGAWASPPWVCWGSSGSVGAASRWREAPSHSALLAEITRQNRHQCTSYHEALFISHHASVNGDGYYEHQYRSKGILPVKVNHFWNKYDNLHEHYDVTCWHDLTVMTCF